MADAVASFMLQDLRRFQMYDSSATRPYTVSAIANYERAARLGYIALDAAGKVRPVVLRLNPVEVYLHPSSLPHPAAC